MIDFDFPMMECMRRELENLLIGGIIHNVYQPYADTLLLPIRRERQTYHLLLSAHFAYPRLHLTDRDWPHPSPPSSFCMLLRKYLRRTRISSIFHPPHLPVLHFHLVPVEAGTREKVVLIGEFVKKYSNIFLVEKHTGLIIESVKHPASPFRQIAPHLPYRAPTVQGYLHPQQASWTEFVNLCRGKIRHLPLWELLHHHILGLNQWTARAVVSRLGLSPAVVGDTLSSEQLREVFTIVQSLYQPQTCTPTLVLQDQEGKPMPVGISALPLPWLSREEVQTVSTLSRACDIYYASHFHQQNFTRKRHTLLQSTEKQIIKLEKRLQTFRQTLQEAEKAEQYLHMGELLKVNLGQIQRGKEAIEVVNYYDPALRPILIPLQPALSPLENVQRYFKKYQKGMKGLEITRTLIRKAEDQLHYLYTVRCYLAQAEEESELEAIEQELIQQGILPRKPSSTPKPQVVSTPRRFRTSDRWEFFVGKNGRQNDLLVTRIGKGDDLWFHVRDKPGAHVLLRNPQRLSLLPEEVLRLGAQLAAYFSSARGEGKVAVGYTPLKFVRKPKGAPPGAVYCQQWQTMSVPPKLPPELIVVLPERQNSSPSPSW